MLIEIKNISLNYKNNKSIYMKDYKDTEKIIYNFISFENGTHLNSRGNTVHEFSRINDNYEAQAQHALMKAGFFPIKTNSSYTVDLFNREMLSNVSFCEGDIYIVQYQTEFEFDAAKANAIQFYQNN